MNLSLPPETALVFVAGEYPPPRGAEPLYRAIQQVRVTGPHQRQHVEPNLSLSLPAEAGALSVDSFLAVAVALLQQERARSQRLRIR